VGAVTDDDRPVDDHVLDPVGELAGLVVGGVALHGLRIEDDDIGDVPVLELAASREAEPGGRRPEDLDFEKAAALRDKIKALEAYELAARG
jgi:hypothetical protein